MVELRSLLTVDAVRIEFSTGGRGGFGPRGSSAAGTPAGSIAHRYRIDVSEDGQGYRTILDRTANDVTRYNGIRGAATHPGALRTTDNHGLAEGRAAGSAGAHGLRHTGRLRGTAVPLLLRGPRH